MIETIHCSRAYNKYTNAYGKLLKGKTLSER